LLPDGLSYGYVAIESSIAEAVAPGWRDNQTVMCEKNARPGLDRISETRRTIGVDEAYIDSCEANYKLQSQPAGLSIKKTALKTSERSIC
jgi:hypothetical protein